MWSDIEYQMLLFNGSFYKLMEKHSLICLISLWIYLCIQNFLTLYFFTRWILICCLTLGFWLLMCWNITHVMQRLDNTWCFLLLKLINLWICSHWLAICLIWTSASWMERQKIMSLPYHDMEHWLEDCSLEDEVDSFFSLLINQGIHSVPLVFALHLMSCHHGRFTSMWNNI